MRRFRVLASWLLLAVLAVGVVGADAVADEGKQPNSMAAGLEALRLRIEAKMKEAELLTKMGKLEEALALYREVGTIYDEGIADLRTLLATARGDAPVAPPRPAPPPKRPGAFGGRPDRTGFFPGRAPSRFNSAKRMEAVKKAIDGGLEWLASRQSPNGSWEAAGFARWLDGRPAKREAQPDGLGKAIYDPGVTGLATLAFLGSGYTHKSDHKYAQVVANALRYLSNIQDPEGCVGNRSAPNFIYNHAIGGLALVEAYGMTRDEKLAEAAQSALDFSALSRNPYFAWRYGVKPGDNDTSVTTWMMLQMKAAKNISDADVEAGRAPSLQYDKASFEGAKAWIDKMTDPDYGRVGYIQRGTGPARPQELIDRFPAERSESMTAAGLLIRHAIGENPATSKVMQLGADLMVKLPPSWNTADGSIDFYYWHYGTLAMSKMGSRYWRPWSAALLDAVVPNQRMEESYGVQGSWDPVGPWGLDGGRVYATALCTMMLQTFQRNAKVFGR